MKWPSTAACVLLLTSLPAGAIAQNVIDFSTVPGGAPADQLAISTQYLADFGVTFALEGGGTPYLERTGAGDLGHGFYNADFAAFDVESTTYAGQLGDYFLRFGTTTFFTAPGPLLIIDYATPVSGASAEIWDIDAAPSGTQGYEQWTISARDANDLVIDTVVSPAGINENLASSMNGKPWTWSFDHPTADIDSITIEFTGTANTVGLAFDNFTPSMPQSVPVGWPVGVVAGLLCAAIARIRLRSPPTQRSA